MNPQKTALRRHRGFPLAPELLETRELLTGGAGNTFAIIPATIQKPGATVSVPFTINSSNFTLPNGGMLLGIDVAPNSGSSVKPMVVSVKDPSGHVIRQTIHSVYDPHVPREAGVSGKETSAVLTTIVLNAQQLATPETYTVQVRSLGKTSGQLLVGFYLPGDVQGNGVVDSTDVTSTSSLVGSDASKSTYNFNADANRDGRINKVDVSYTKQNVGVSTTITPVVAANLVSSSVTNPSARTSASPSAQFTGTASPGAMITYTEINNNNGAPVSTTADSMGNYTINVPLGPGSNTFNVQSIDPFGQTIAGEISPVFYTASDTTTG